MLVEEPLWPMREAAVCIKTRRRDNGAAFGALEVVNRDIRGRNQTIVHGDPNAVQKVVAVGLDEHLEARFGRSDCQFSQPRLAPRMKMCLRILDQAERSGWHEQGQDDGKRVGEAKTDVGCAMALGRDIVRPVKCEAGDHGVGGLDRLEVKMGSWTYILQPVIHNLHEPASGAIGTAGIFGAEQVVLMCCQVVQRVFAPATQIPAPRQDFGKGIICDVTRPDAPQPDEGRGIARDCPGRRSYGKKLRSPSNPHTSTARTAAHSLVHGYSQRSTTK